MDQEDEKDPGMSIDGPLGRIRLTEDSAKILDVTCKCGTFMLRTGADVNGGPLEFKCALCGSTMKIPLDGIEFEDSGKQVPDKVDAQRRVFRVCEKLLESAFPMSAGSWLVGVMYEDGESFNVKYGGGIVHIGGLAMQTVMRASREHATSENLAVLVGALGGAGNEDTEN